MSKKLLSHRPSSLKQMDQMKTQGQFIEQIFQDLDQDMSGTLSFQEWSRAIRKVLPQATIKEIKQILRHHNFKQAGEITTVEFVEIIMKKKSLDSSLKKEWTEAYRLFDDNLDGILSAKELKAGLERYGETMSLQDLEMLVSMGDKDKDGCINFNEFVRMMSLQ